MNPIPSITEQNIDLETLDSLADTLNSFYGPDASRVDVVAAGGSTQLPLCRVIAIGSLSSHPDFTMDSTQAANREQYPILKHHERKRDKAKRFMVEKGPRIAAAAATTAMFVFNIVSNCC